MDEREYQFEHAKQGAAERELVTRLYYGLWIVFLGGFVLSLHVVVLSHPRMAFILVVAFRLLAVLGTAINFWMQYHSLKSLSAWRMRLFYSEYRDKRAADTLEKSATDSDLIVRKCEKPLQIIAGLFLLVALVGSFLVRVP